MPASTSALAREIKTIRSSFRQIARSFGRIAPLLADAATPARNGDRAEGVRRKPRLTADQRRALKLQGKYMGTMRGLKPSDRARIKRIRAARGIRAAIAAAQKMAS